MNSNKIFKNSKYLKDFMQSKGVAFNRRLGQNFLMQNSVLKKIVKVANIEGYDIFEVGAGIGNLTELLIRSAKKVVAIELDAGLFKILKNRFYNVENLAVLNCDVLKIDLPRLFKLEFSGLPVKICANLPYYITSKFVASILERTDLNLDSLILMVQKEAALRLCAKPGSKNCSAISYLVHYYSVPKILFDVSRNNFFPVPNVNSCVIKLKIRKKRIDFLEINDELKFFRFIRVAFSQRRKIMISPISDYFNLDKNMLKVVLEKLGLSAVSRAQELNLEQFAQVFKAFF